MNGVRRTIITRVYGILLVLTIVFSLFNWVDMYLPSIVKILFVNESMASTYPAIVLAVLVFCENVRQKNIYKYRWLLVLFIIFFLMNTCVNLHSILTFKYFDNASYNALEGGPKYAFIIIQRLFPNFSNKEAYIISYIIRTEINLVREFIFSWFIVYNIAIYFLDNDDAISYFYMGLLFAFCIVFFYSIFEIANKIGLSFGTKVLRVVNPFLYPVESINYWYPVLISSVIRNVFSEASFFSYWACLVLPFFVLLYFFKDKKYIFCILVILTNLVCTESRTAYILLSFQLLLFFFFFILCLIKRKISDNNTLNCHDTFFVPTKKSAMLFILVLVMSLFLGINIISFSNNTPAESTFKESDNYRNTQTITKGLESAQETFSSFNDIEKRSNKSRFLVFISRMRIWLSNLIFGVGDELVGDYIKEQVESSSITLNWELENWCRKQDDNSLFNAFSSLDYYSRILAGFGLIGFFIYIFPLLFFIIVNFIIFLENLKRKKYDDIGLNIALIISLCMVFLFGFCNSIDNNPLLYILYSLSITFLIRYNYHKKEKNEANSFFY